jgi:hypothetical protein
MQKLFKIFLFVLVCTVIFACSKSNEENLNTGNNNPGGGNPSGCDTANMKYSADILPIIQSNCYACHSNANQSISGLSLQGYENLKPHADDGMLMGVITHASGYTPMPQGGAKLSDCNINKIRDWVLRGAPNN